MRQGADGVGVFPAGEVLAVFRDHAVAFVVPAEECGRVGGAVDGLLDPRLGGGFRFLVGVGRKCAVPAVLVGVVRERRGGDDAEAGVGLVDGVGFEEGFAGQVNKNSRLC